MRFLTLGFLVGGLAGVWSAGAWSVGAAENVLSPSTMTPRATVAPRFVALAAFDFRALLPAPPAAGSLAAAAKP